MICICKTGNDITHPEVARGRRPLRGVDGMYILWEEMVSSLDWPVRVGIELAKCDIILPCRFFPKIHGWVLENQVPLCNH